MFGAIVWKEFQTELTNFRVILASLAAILLVGITTYVACLEFNQRVKSYQAKLHALSQQEQDIYVYSQLHPHLLRQPEPLSILSRGPDSIENAEVEINIYSLPVEPVGNYHGHAYQSLLSRFDVTEVIIFVLGLLAFLMTFDALCGEKESGTLALILSGAVPRAILFGGKFVAVALCLALLLLILYLETIGVILSAADLSSSSLDWGRYTFLFMTYLLYVVVMILAGLMVSGTVRRSSTSLMVCMLLWILMVAAYPQAVLSLSHLRAPRDEIVQMEVQRLRAERDQKIKSYKGSRALFGAVRTLDQTTFVVRAFNLLPTSVTDYEKFIGHQNRVLLDYAQRIGQVELAARQQRLRHLFYTQLLAALSPAYALKALSQSVAGTSEWNHEDWLAATRLYREAFLNYLDSKQGLFGRRWFTDDPPHWEFSMRADLVKLGQDPSRRLTLSDLPRFQYRPRSLPSAAPLAVGSLLLTLLGLLFIISGIGFARYDPRAG